MVREVIRKKEGKLYIYRTRFDYIHTNVIDASVNLLSHKFRGRMMNVKNALSILGCQSCSCRHSIAPMSGDDLLIRFKPADTRDQYENNP